VSEQNLNPSVDTIKPAPILRKKKIFRGFKNPDLAIYEFIGEPTPQE